MKEFWLIFFSVCSGFILGAIVALELAKNIFGCM